MRLHTTAVALLLLSSASFAETELKLQQCSDVKESDQNYWTELSKASTELDTLLASKETDFAVILDSYKTWSVSVLNSTKQLDKAFQPQGDITLTEMTQDYFDEYLDADLFKGSNYPKFEYRKLGSDAPTAIQFSIIEEGGIEASGRFELNMDSIAQCEEVVKCQGRTPTKVTSCHMLAESFRNEANAHFARIKEREAVLVAKYAVATGKKWDRYHNEARFQYPWEKTFTAWLLREELSSDKFVTPPSYQYHIGRIWAAMEYVGDADDGSQFKVAPTVEWVGINSWETCRVFGHELFKKACGVSAVSTWTDRGGVSDVGHGAMLHFDNKYSFGATWRSEGDVGFFLTVDLLKALESKQESIKSWQDKVEEYLPLD